jgi:hypothetical protein
MDARNGVSSRDVFIKLQKEGKQAEAKPRDGRRWISKMPI